MSKVKSNRNNLQTKFSGEARVLKNQRYVIFYVKIFKEQPFIYANT